MILLKSIAPICLALLIVLPGCKERQTSQSSNSQPAASPTPNPAAAVSPVPNPVAAPKEHTPRVALIYSSYAEGSRKGELDGAEKILGWKIESFENTRVEELIPRLSEFQFVVLATAGNFKNVQDLGRHRQQWLDFLQGGGSIVVIAANYDNVLAKFTDQFGPDYPVTAAPFEGGVLTAVGVNFDMSGKATDHWALTIPTDIRDVMLNKNAWAGLTNFSSAWQSALVSSSGPSRMLVRSVGKGSLVLLAAGEFGKARGPRAIAGLLGNLRFHEQGMKKGVALEKFDLGPALPGKRSVLVTLRNSTQNATPVSLRIVAKNSKGSATFDQSANLPPNAATDVQIPVDLAGDGPQAVKLEISAAGQQVAQVERELVIPSTIALISLDPNLYPERKSIRFDLTLAPELGTDLKDCTVEINAGGKNLPRFTPDSASFTRVMEFAEVPPGSTVEVTARLLKGNQLLGEASTEIRSHETPRVLVNRGKLYVEGRGFFPLGMYHVMHNLPPARQIEGLRALAAGGYNSIYTYVYEDPQTAQKLFEEADKLNIWVIGEGRGVDALLKAGPSPRRAFAWVTKDEPELWSIPPSKVAEVHMQLRKADPQVPTYTVVATKSRIKDYTFASSLIITDPYPLIKVPSGQGGPLRAAPVYLEMVELVACAAATDSVPIAVLSCHGYEPQQIPTYQQVRNQVWQSLVAGVRGLIFYTFEDYLKPPTPGFQLEKFPELYQGMMSLPAEINPLMPILLEAKRTELLRGEDQAVASFWVNENEALLAVVNISGETKKVRLDIPSVGKLSLVPDTVNPSLKIDGQTLSGELAPLEIATLRWKR
ncbi:MAG: hypothetical protein NTZ08_05155 [Verrucomicrobia bacterium]|nr:hypothetical protein [Verrucomicrobiota bacterium]